MNTGCRETIIQTQVRSIVSTVNIIKPVCTQYNGCIWKHFLQEWMVQPPPVPQRTPWKYTIFFVQASQWRRKPIPTSVLKDIGSMSGIFKTCIKFRFTAGYRSRICTTQQRVRNVPRQKQRGHHIYKKKVNKTTNYSIKLNYNRKKSHSRDNLFFIIFPPTNMTLDYWCLTQVDYVGWTKKRPK